MILMERIERIDRVSSWAYVEGRNALMLRGEGSAAGGGRSIGAPGQDR
jgi:hypothetical protein